MMEIKTERLYIRTIQADDWIDLKNIWNDFSKSEYAQYDVSHKKSDEQVKNQAIKFEQYGLYYIVFLGNEVIGYVDFHDTGKGYDMGYCFLSEYHGKGYAKESCKALLEYHLGKGIQRFTAGTGLKNIPSVHLLQSLGFEQIGIEKVSFYKDEQGKDIYFDGGIYELSFNHG